MLAGDSLSGHSQTGTVKLLKGFRVTAVSVPYPLVPYGWADFRAIRLEGRLYVDKTGFLRPLENERLAFLIRPRRFGKS